LDDQMSDHPKITAAGNAAVGAWARMLSWSGRYATDGLIPAGVARGYATRAELARLRVPGPSGAPMLHGPGDECRCLVTGPVTPAGWYALHDFDQYNERGAELRLRRARKQELRDPALRLAVRDRDRDHCRYCGVLCTLTGPRRLVLDHVEPGRVEGAANLVVACHACNSAKGNRTPAEAGMELLPAGEWRLSHTRTTMDSRSGAGGDGARVGAGTRAYAREAKPGTAGPTGVRPRLAVPDRRDHSGQPHWRGAPPDQPVPDWPPGDAEVIP
jgi:5-methylcytosine-specific restriction endonuclease McrA